MTSCCSPTTSSFPVASTLSAQASTSPIVWAEISALQQAILSTSGGCSCSGSGQFGSCYGGATPMTFVSGVTSVTVTNGRFWLL